MPQKPLRESADLEEVTRARTARRTRAAATRANPRAREARDREPPGLGEHPRYEDRGVLGAGGQGVVLRVFDRALDREAALKTVRSLTLTEAESASVMEEARATARLGHPSVVPIFDIGRLPDGRPYYTMQLVTGSSLARLLDRLFEEQEAGPPGEASREWGVVRLVQALEQVCNALQQAHEAGVVHRDVKPANIMLGEHGQVLLVDWGIAKRTDGSGRGSGLAPLASEETLDGLVKGTLHYMSPEQLRGEPLDARSDVHAIGVVLYEMLTLLRPFEDEGSDVSTAILAKAPPDPRRTGGPRHVPDDLAELALRCLAKSPADRPQSAREVSRALRDHVEGVSDRERRLRAAAAIREEAEEAMTRHREAAAEAVRLDAELAVLEREHPPWQPVEEKGRLIEARKRREDLDVLTWSSFIDGVNRFTDALAHVPEHADLRRALSDIFWPRFVAAEEAGRHLEAVTYRKLVERFHDGRHARELDGSAALRVEVHPKDAVLELRALVEDGLVLVDGPARALGAGDVHLEKLAMGSYVLVARREGFVTARYPACIERGRDWVGELRLPREGEIPEGFVFIPGCEAPLGGDALARNSWPLRRVKIESFAIGRHPVTMGEYCAFLDDIGERAEREDLVPRTGTEGHACERGSDGAWRFGLTPTRQLEARGPAALDRLPVFGIDLQSCEVYARWRSDRDGREYRLPTAEEWELAARGVDRRPLPWGWRFDAALCHVRQSLPDEPDLAPVNTFVHDRSVYGVHDLGGGVRQWTASRFDAAGDLCEVRGSDWSNAADRSAYRGQVTRDIRDARLGFRLAASVAGSASSRPTAS